MRPQYHFRRLPQGLCAWNVRRLVELSRDLPRERVLLSAIRELDEPYWSNEGTESVTCRDIVDHARLMLDCDLSFPIILSSDGRIMDGMHRACKAAARRTAASEIDKIRVIRSLSRLRFDVRRASLGTSHAEP